MKNLLRAAALAVFAFIVCPVAAIAQAADDTQPRPPKNAFDKPERQKALAAQVRDKGEVRVILGLQTTQETARGPDEARGSDHAADPAKEQAVTARQQRVLQRAAGHNVRQVKGFRWHHFMAATVDATALAALLADPEVTSVSEDRVLYPVLYDTPGITRASMAWAEGFRGAGQTVAILDTGVDKTHPFFTGKVVAEACFSHPGVGGTTYCPNGQIQQIGSGAGVNCPDSSLGCWHGTHVAGIAAGKYGVLAANTGGIAPDASVIAIQVFQRQCFADGSCRIVAYESDLIRALEHVYSLRNTYAIASANMSLGGTNYSAPCDSESPAMTSVVQTLRSAGIATVAAAGNESTINAISFPGCLSAAVSVGSTTKQNQISSFSNSASFLSLLAPGSGITSSVPGGGFGGASGTSMATPHVAGAFAVLKQAKPAATVGEVLAALQNGGLPITDPRNGITKSLIQIGYDAMTPGALGLVTGITSIAPTVVLTSPSSGQIVAAPASITISANAADADGGIAKVEFFRDSFKIGEVTAPGPYSITYNNVQPGIYVFTARATDIQGGSTNSGSATVTVTGSPPASINAALALNGAVASASSQYTAAPYDSSSLPPAAAINGDRKGANWNTGGIWHDATANAFPDSLQIVFNGVKSIGEIDVFSVQDNYVSPVEPTPTLTFTQFGLTAFQVQYWTGSAWVDVPGGNVTGNNLVWRKLTFSLISTDRIRVLVNAALGSYSRIAEVEAWTATPGGNAPPTVNLTSPPNNTTLGAPATVNLSADAADSDGTISKVEFYRDATLIQTVTSPISGTTSSGTWTYSDTNVGIGAYSYTAKAYDNLNAVTTSTPATTVNVTAGGAVNVASQANGGVASASSQYTAAPYDSTSFPPAAAINGDRKGLNWNTGGIWHDATANAWPDSLQINFNGVKSIGEIDVFSVQDNYPAPAEPTPVMTFTQYGLSEFQVQYWTGSAWVDVPGGNVTGNNLVWRKFTFSPFSTDRIRVLVNAGLGSFSRIAEVEAWTAAAGGNPPPTVSLTSPANNVTLAAPATVNLSADAADADGTISKVEFYRDTTLIQTVTSPSSGTAIAGTWTYSDTNVAGGIYSYTARAYDNLNAFTTTTPATTVNVTAGGAVNVALQASGGVASASTQYTSAPYNSTSFPPAAVNNGDRKGMNWSAGGIWHDATANAFPDSLQINFNGSYSIGEIDVFSVQDNFGAPADPTPAMAFTQYGLAAFQVQYWIGSAFADVPGGNVTGNNLVWRKFTFSPISTDRIRVLVNSGLGSFSRIAEVEAWTAAGQTTYQLTGTVSLNGAPLAAVALSATGNVGCTSTNASGQYSCTVPPGWSGTVTPSLAGYTFTPASRNYNNVAADLSGQGYSATALTASLQSVASGFSSPLGIEHAGDSRLFVVQQGGQIRILSGGAVLPTPFLDISTLISTGGEQGLLGLAFHPNYAANGYFYVNYTRQGDGATVIARYQRSAGDPNVADPASATILLAVAQPFANHNGGQLRFGPDGYLYIGLGDGGSANDPGNRAQDLSTLLGKMLRIDVDGGSPYAVPASNPFVNDGNPGTLPEIWAYGLRNPWRFSFDRLTGDLFIADVGQGAREEINFQAAGTGAGANYGWRVMEGSACTGLGGGPACFDASLILPILEYDHSLGCSVTGGHRYRGAANPALAGYFVYGDFCNGRIWGSTRSANGVWSTAQLLLSGFSISTFGEDAGGEVYVAAYNTGVIYRISAQ